MILKPKKPIYFLTYSMPVLMFLNADAGAYADSPIFPSVESSKEYQQTIQSYDLDPIIKTSPVGQWNLPTTLSQTASGIADQNVSFKDFPDSPVTKSTLENKLTHGSGATLSPSGVDGHSNFVRGNGIDSSEVQTTFQGLSLNSVAGSGYDLASFPAWFWNSATLSPGFDRLNFSLQTDADVKTDFGRDDVDLSKSKIFASASTESAYTAGVAHSRPGHYSIQTGMLMGRVVGPALSLSNRLQLNSKTEVYQHVLLMNKETTFYKSNSVQIATGVQNEVRVIPVLEVNRKLLDGVFGVTGAYDWSQLKYKGAYDTRDFGDRTSLVGTFKHPDWDFEARVEQVHYRTLSMDSISETNTKSELKHLFELGDRSFTLTPGVGLKGQVSGGPVRTSTIPFDPIASLGLKKVWGQDAGKSRQSAREVASKVEGNGVSFIRSQTPKFSSDIQVRYDHSDPSLVNRFYRLPGFFEGNPNLQPDHWVKAESTHELEVYNQRLGLSVFGQRRWDVQQNTMTANGLLTVQNVGQASSFGLSPYVNIRPVKWLDGSMRLNFKQSRLDSSQSSTSISSGGGSIGDSFTFEPSKEFFASVMASIETDFVKLHFGPDFHAVSSYSSSYRSVFFPNGSTQPGFGLVSFQMSSEWSGGFDVQASLQNIFDKQVEWAPGTPAYAREVTLAISARL